MKAGIGVLLKDKHSFESPLLIAYSRTEIIDGKEKTIRVLRQQIPDLLVKESDFIKKNERKRFIKEKGWFYVKDDTMDEKVCALVNETKAYLKQYSESHNGNYPTGKELKENFFNYKQAKVIDSDMLDDMQSELFIRATHTLDESDEISENTKITRRSLLKKLQEFSKETKTPITYSNMDEYFFDAWKEWMITEGQIINTRDKKGNIIKSKRVGISRNAFATYLIVLKGFLNIALKKDKHQNTKFRDWKFKRPKKRKKDRRQLASKEQIKLLEGLKLGPLLQESLDAWLALYYTALRYSDLHKINPGNESDGLLLIFDQKTETDIEIPINPKLRKIWKRYGNKPPAPHQTTMNMRLKVIGAMVGLPNLACHDSRRSQCQHLIDAGASVQDILSITGQKSEATLKIYAYRPPQGASNRLKNFMV